MPDPTGRVCVSTLWAFICSIGKTRNFKVTKQQKDGNMPGWRRYLPAGTIAYPWKRKRTRDEFLEKSAILKENAQFNDTEQELRNGWGVPADNIKMGIGNSVSEMEKLLKLCQFFLFMDRLFLENMNSGKWSLFGPYWGAGSFRMVRYAVISHDPESDALNHIWKRWAEENGISGSWGRVNRIMSWDFPIFTEQVMYSICMAMRRPVFFPRILRFPGKDMEAVAQKRKNMR